MWYWLHLCGPLQGLGRHTLSHALVNILPVAHPATSDPVTWKLLLASNALTQHVSPALRAALRDAYEDAAQHGSTQHDTSQSAALQVGSGSAAPSDASAAAGSHGGPDVTSLLLTAHMSARYDLHSVKPMCMQCMVMPKLLAPDSPCVRSVSTEHCMQGLHTVRMHMQPSWAFVPKSMLW